ncbi:hypothetical protein JX266_010346 [Neoarthrinium moseri]|nr:hypothetical protein JX266_010346 [Neoarthrinium moseri]
MSLNGLDNAAVKEAHEAATAEPGGWFLLKYASRDEVDVYGRGTGGIVEMRNAIANYEDPSPLYGFLKYRRRNVILKYQPEDCSRLVQARATVHFNAVCERFAPYNTTFEITTAKELKDTKLSAACSLHTASGSSSSSNSSLRRRRLIEITEEEEEEERERKRQSIVQEERPGTAGDTTAAGLPPSSPPEPAVVLDKEQLNRPQEPNFASTAEEPTFEGVRPTSPAKSDFHVQENRRLSSQTARPDLFSYSTYTYGKPKVKLAPRPSLEANKRPHTAGTFRPVAALPAGFKLASKGSKRGRSGSRDKTDEEADLEQDASELPALNTSITIPEVPAESEATTLPPRPNTSSGASVQSVPAMVSAKDNKMTPEKARLMKAMKMREQRKKMSIMTSAPAPIAEVPVAPVVEKIEESSEQLHAEETAEAHDDDSQLSLSHADSAIAVDLPTPLTVSTEATADDTFTDSHPASPTVASSEIGESTKASSLSDSTDETIQATKEAELDYNDKGRDTEADLATNLSKSSDSAEPETHDGIGAHEITPVTSEIERVPEAREATSKTIEPETIMQSIEVEDASPSKLDVRSQEVGSPQDGEESPKSPYGIPVSKFSSNDKSPTTPSLKSKFSTQDLKVPSEPVPALPTLITPPTAAPTPDLPHVEGDRSDAPSPDPSHLVPARSAKHKISPIRTDLARETPESEISDPLLDDALMDELQAATVQEAVMISKSPITPVFPSTSPKRPHTMADTKPPPSRAFSNPMRGPLLSPGDVSSSSARSVSAGGAAFLHSITRQPSNAGLSTKKGTGNSIAQRIKALEQLSGKSSSEDLKAKSSAPATSFISVRKQQSIRDSSKSPSLTEPARPMSRKSPTPDRTREESPEVSSNVASRSRSGSVASRLSMFQHGAQQPRGRPESIQVTARIVRDPNQSFPRRPASRDPEEYNSAELRQSPLVVDHLKAMPEAIPTSQPEPAQLPAVDTPKETIQERRLSRDRKASVSEDEVGLKRRTSLSIVKDFIKERRQSITSKSTDNLAALSPAPTSAKSPSRPPSVHQTSGSSLARRLSISSRRSSFSRENDNSTPLMSPSAVTDASSDDADKASLGDKKSKSRTQRFMRRLSNSLGGTRKTLTPNTPTTVREEDEVIGGPSAGISRTTAQPALAAYMGDVNVQFPDNLLWKRRSLCLDAQGFLILSAVQGAASSGTEKSGIKRYHLSDFRQPYIPDVDVQELPNSICLDFVEGSSLQLACEDRPGQKHVLTALQDAHQTHNSFGH